MRTTDFLPVCRKGQEVLAVEGHQRSLLLRGKRELFLIRTASVSGISSCQTIDPMLC